MHRAILILVILIFPFGAAACTSTVGRDQERPGYMQSTQQRIDLSNPTSVGPFKLDDRWSTGIVQNGVADPTVQKATKDAKKVLETNLELYYNSFGLNSTPPINYGLDGERD